MSTGPTLLPLLAKTFAALAHQARLASWALRRNRARASADAAADWADELHAVAVALAADIVPVGAVARLRRAHQVLLAEIGAPSGASAAPRPMPPER